MNRLAGQRLATLVAAGVAAAVLAACGGSSSSTNSGASSPSAALKMYLTSVANGDGAGACSVLASSLQNRALSTARSQGIKASSCADLFSQIKARMSTAQRTAFLTASVTNVVQSGTSATATVSGASGQPTLTERSGKWLISGGIGF
jgi:hypothetical protein